MKALSLLRRGFEHSGEGEEGGPKFINNLEGSFVTTGMRDNWLYVIYAMCPFTYNDLIASNFLAQNQQNG